MTVEDWSRLALAGAGVFGMAAISMTLFSRRTPTRTLYWVFVYIAVTCLALFATPRGWRAAIEHTAWGVAAAVGYAFFATPFLKIRGRILAAEIENTRPDPVDGAAPDRSAPTEAESYNGRHSAAATWWVLAVCSCLLGLGLVLTRWSPPVLIVVAIGSLLSAILGFEDGSRGFSYARGHILPFRIAAAASLVAAGIPLLSYVAAYRKGARRPGYGRHDAVRIRRRRSDDR